MVMLINNSVAHVHIAHRNNAMKIETNMSPVAMWNEKWHHFSMEEFLTFRRSRCLVWSLVFVSMVTSQPLHKQRNITAGVGFSCIGQRSISKTVSMSSQTELLKIPQTIINYTTRTLCQHYQSEKLQQLEMLKTKSWIVWCICKMKMSCRSHALLLIRQQSRPTHAGFGVHSEELH